jgi:hypothetical protein
MVKRSSAERFVSYVNKHLGKPMLTTSISNRTRLNLRRVQMFCKSVREGSPSKVTWEIYPKNGRTRSIRYTFNRPINNIDVSL